MNQSQTLNETHWSEKLSVLGFLQSCARLKADENVTMESQAHMNAAWYRGDQLLFWNADTRQLESQSNDYGRVRLTYNLMYGQIEGFVSMLGLSPINLTVEASTEDLLDFERARLQSQVLEYYGNALNLRRIQREADLAAVLHGETYLKVTWNPEAGPEYGELGAGDPQLEKGNGRGQRNLRQGDLAVTHVPMFNVFWGPPGIPFDEADWVVEVYNRSLAAVAERYDLNPQEISTSDDHEHRRYLWPSETSRFGQMLREEDRNVVEVVELWVRPNRRISGLERGRHVIAVGDKVVLNGHIPYKHQRIPIVRYGLIDAPGTTRGTTFVTNLLPLQNYLNRSISQHMENQEYMANPSWVVPETAIVDEAEWNTQIGGIRRFRGALPPRIEPGATMPASVQVMIEYTERKMQDIVGLRDASSGRNPAGVRAARTVLALREGDENRMSKIAYTRNEVWRQAGWLMLLTLQQYIKERRIGRILGDEQIFQSVVFDNEALAGRNQKGLAVSLFDVRVGTSGRPRSRSSRLEDLDRLLERGFLVPGDPADKAYVLEMLSDQESRRRPDRKAAARQSMWRRCLAMANGKYLSPEHWEDTEAQEEVVYEFCNKDFFRRLDPGIQALFERYKQECMKIRAVKTIRDKAVIQQALDEAQQIPELARVMQQPVPAPAVGAGQPPSPGGMAPAMQQSGLPPE